MLDNPFLVPSLCKLNHISLCFIQISTKSPAKLLISFRESTVFFLSHPRCFGPLGKFQHNIKISIKTARVSTLSVSCDYDKNGFNVKDRSSCPEVLSQKAVLKVFIKLKKKTTVRRY